MSLLQRKSKDSSTSKPVVAPSSIVSYSSGFVFDAASEAKLAKEAHPDLVKVFREALRISKVNFKVGEVARTKSRQIMLKAQGKSQTTRSRHLVNPKDGKAYAIDVYAIVNGRVSWDWQYYIEICRAVQLACKKYGVHIVWGGNWNIDLCVSNLEPKEIHKLYRGTLSDGVHFELSRSYYGEY